MFGIGGLVKRTIAQGKIKASDWRMSKTDPAALDYFHRLKVECYAPEYFIYVFEPLKTIYVEVPKAASTTVLATFAQALTGRTYANVDIVHERHKTGLQGPRELGLDRFHHMIDKRDFRSFTFVRNPYKRLVSCWVDKIAAKTVRQNGLSVRQLLSLPEAKRFTLDPDAPIPFPVFVELACASAAMRLNGHWNLMSDIVPRSLLPIDFIGKVETLQRDLPIVLEMAGISNSATMQTMNVKHMHPHGQMLTQDLADLIYKSYEEDFDRFHYARDWK